MVVAAIARRIFGSVNDRRVKKLQPKVDAINALEDEVSKLSDDALRARTEQFRAEYANGKSLEDLLVPAFATVREAAKRTLGLRLFDVQLIGGMVLNDRSISEMRTGEGKTLVATLPVYLNALTGKGVHVVTVNDYLASRDAEWMGQVYRFLGLSVGTIVHGLSDPERKASYAADVTYGTNNEFGFDYLRDNMKFSRDQMVQRGHAYAIVDEVDSILIDEARTPLIISGPSEDRSALYAAVDLVIPIIGEGDFELEEKHRSATFTDQGIEKLEEKLREEGLLKEGSLYDIENVSLVHHLNSALRAHKLFTRDKDYIVRNDEVVIIDEFTGRMMPGRALFRRPAPSARGQGTRQDPVRERHARLDHLPELFQALRQAGRHDRYGGDRGRGIRRHLWARSRDHSDQPACGSCRRRRRRLPHGGREIRRHRRHDRGLPRTRPAPVLVGTTSIGKSEMLAETLQKRGLKDIKVLNARYHEQEAFIVADAGVSGAVTIATNMAGRGTDIQLGGNLDMRVRRECEGLEGAARDKKIAAIKDEIAVDRQKVIEAGGLMIIGTERHESRRIDNQLRGRAGRQGDPGRSKFYLSLQDDLMRIFPVEGMDKMLSNLGLEDGESITHPWVSKAIEKAQGKVEARNFDIRKNILKFDDVMNDQRKVIFEQRLELMDDDNVSETVTGMRHDVIDALMARTVPERAYPEQWESAELTTLLRTHLGIDAPVADWAAEEGIDIEKVRERLVDLADRHMASKTARFTPDIMRQVEKSILLQSVDNLWREHLITLDHLSKVIGWRGLAQRDPLNEYKQESYELFQALLNNLRELVTTQLAHVELQQRPPEPRGPDLSQLEERHIDPTTGENDAASGVSGTMPSAGAMAGTIAGAAGRAADGTPLAPIDPALLKGVRRNDPCPCGSGKKFKHCHGAF